MDRKDALWSLGSFLLVWLLALALAAALGVFTPEKEKSMKCTRLYPKPGVVISRCEEIKP